MGKQINSAKKMENNSKQTQDTLAKKETKKIDDYFNLGNKKRLRDDSEKAKDDGVLKSSNKSDNQINNIAPILKDQASDFKSKILFKGLKKIFSYFYKVLIKIF